MPLPESDTEDLRHPSPQNNEDDSDSSSNNDYDIPSEDSVTISLDKV